jgi:hypothetical protein
LPEIVRRTEVGAGADPVWRVLADARRLPEVSASTVEVNGAPDELRAVGDSFHQVVRLLGRTYDSEWRVVDIEPGRRLVIEGSIGFGVRYRLDERIEPLGPDRSRLEVRIDYRLPFGPLGRLAAKLGVESRAAAEATEVVDGVRRLAERESGGHDSVTPATSHP